MYSVVVPQVSSSGTSDASNKSIASSSGGGGMGYQVFKKGIQDLDKYKLFEEAMFFVIILLT